MTRILFIFMDGIGLGDDDPEVNPFSAAELPNLSSLLDGKRIVRETPPAVHEKASLLNIDAQMEIKGKPQSATGQASLVTGKDVSAIVGEHYGPKPNKAVAEVLRKDNIFKDILAQGGSTTLINAYPPRYFEAIESGRRIYSAIPMAVDAAGIQLMTFEDLRTGEAMAVDFTSKGWNSQEDFPAAPEYAPAQAGKLLAELSAKYDLCWFDYWLSDYAGHHRDMEMGISLLETFDAVLGGLLESWDTRRDLIVVSSDHGNMEDMTVRGHTVNEVPGLVIGPNTPRKIFSENLRSLKDFAPSILNAIFEYEPS